MATIARRIYNAVSTDLTAFLGFTEVQPSESLDIKPLVGPMLQCKLQRIDFTKLNVNLSQVIVNTAHAQITLRAANQNRPSKTAYDLWSDYLSAVLAWINSLTFPLAVAAGDSIRIDQISLQETAPDTSTVGGNHIDTVFLLNVLFTIL